MFSRLRMHAECTFHEGNMNEFATRAKVFEAHIREAGLEIEPGSDVPHYTLFRVPFDPSDRCRLEWHHDAGEFMVDLSFWHPLNPVFCMSRVQFARQPGDHVFVYWDLGHAVDDSVPREVRACIVEMGASKPKIQYPVAPGLDEVLPLKFIERYRRMMGLYRGEVR